MHILGVAGTFMAGLAALAKELGYTVTGSDQAIYPPMSTQLAQMGIELMPSLALAERFKQCDEVVIGNALSRGHAAVEEVLNQRCRYTSGAQWLAEHVLATRDVLAIAGTHGKTTTTALAAWLLDAAGVQPGFLIGGVTLQFPLSARLGQGRVFVVEADEYDTAFFDKRSKFVHYRPLVAILNNLEFDHADIFENIQAIQRQFHYLVRTVPGCGRLIVNGDDPLVAQVLAQGCWSSVERVGWTDGCDWSARILDSAGSTFVVCQYGQEIGQVQWRLAGRHNVQNALMALAGVHALNVPVKPLLAKLADYRGVKRRLELLTVAHEIAVYDDFAHHPTAIAATLATVRAQYPAGRVIAVFEPRSNSMQLGVHQQQLVRAFDAADYALLYCHPGLSWDLEQLRGKLTCHGLFFTHAEELLQQLQELVRPGDQVVFMSNGGFDQLPQRFVVQLQAAWRQ